MSGNDPMQNPLHYAPIPRSESPAQRWKLVRPTAGKPDAVAEEPCLGACARLDEAADLLAQGIMRLRRRSPVEMPRNNLAFLWKTSPHGRVRRKTA
jgi:hypothetical protein